MLSTGFSTDTDESMAVFQTLFASQYSGQFVLLIGSRPSRPQFSFPITPTTCYVHTFWEKVVGLVLLFAKRYVRSKQRPIAGSRIKIILTISVNVEEAGKQKGENMSKKNVFGQDDHVLFINYHHTEFWPYNFGTKNTYANMQYSTYFMVFKKTNMQLILSTITI